MHFVGLRHATGGAMRDRSRPDGARRVLTRRRRSALAVTLAAATVAGLLTAGLIGSPAASAPRSCLTKPDATNTGASGIRTASKVKALIKPGSKLSNAELTAGLTIYGNGSTVRNVSVNGAIVVTGDRVTLDRVTAKRVIVYGASKLTVRRSNLSGGGTAVYVASDRQRGQRASRLKLSRNYIHDPAAEARDSYSGTQLRGVQGVTITCSNYALGAYGRAAILTENLNGGTSRLIGRQELAGWRWIHRRRQRQGRCAAEQHLRHVGQEWLLPGRSVHPTKPEPDSRRRTPAALSGRRSLVEQQHCLGRGYANRSRSDGDPITADCHVESDDVSASTQGHHCPARWAALRHGIRHLPAEPKDFFDRGRTADRHVGSGRASQLELFIQALGIHNRGVGEPYKPLGPRSQRRANPSERRRRRHRDSRQQCHGAECLGGRQHPGHW